MFIFLYTFQKKSTETAMCPATPPNTQIHPLKKPEDSGLILILQHTAVTSLFCSVSPVTILPVCITKQECSQESNPKGQQFIFISFLRFIAHTIK